MANGTEFGLGAYVHTQNLRRAHHVASQLDAGMIHVNGGGFINAAGVMAIVPPVIIAIMFERYIVSGLTAGAVKG